MDCPSCRRPMVSETLEAHLERTVTIEVCGPCQVLWFDTYESLQLSAGATLRLFKTIGEESPHAPPDIPQGLHCPRCQAPLLPTRDMQRNTRFSYWRCREGHGRLIRFYDFLREKDFIRPLSPDQVDALRRDLQAVNCANCGAAIDLARDSVCAHCGSPLSMLDLHHAERLIAELRQQVLKERAKG